MFNIAIVVLLFSCAIAQPNKPVWPNQFDAAFGLNVPEIPNSNPPIVNASAHFYYNWDVQAQLIDYIGGCIPLFEGAYKFPCQLFFNPNGVYLSMPQAGTDCCLLFPGVGSVPPNFLAPFNYSGYDTIAFDYSGTAFFTHFWVAIDGFQYWTDSKDQFGRDIQFADGGNVLWNWAPLNVVNQNPSIFDLPSGNCNANCSAGMNVLSDPMVKLAIYHSRYFQ